MSMTALTTIEIKAVFLVEVVNRDIEFKGLDRIFGEFLGQALHDNLAGPDKRNSGVDYLFYDLTHSAVLVDIGDVEVQFLSVSIAHRAVQTTCSECVQAATTRTFFLKYQLTVDICNELVEIDGLLGFIDQVDR